MRFKLLVLIFNCILTGYVFAHVNESDTKTATESPNYNPALNPDLGCTGLMLWCDIKFGLGKAENVGVNGVMINGYAYHTTVGPHWPTGYDSAGGVSEVALGAGYTRTFYNPQYNSEYFLYVMGFMDSFYKPEIHAGYAFQKYFNMTDSGNLKWGIGYTPFVFVKPSLTKDFPLPLPGAGILTSIRYYKVDVMLIYANELFLNAKVDF